MGRYLIGAAALAAVVLASVTLTQSPLPATAGAGSPTQLIDAGWVAVVIEGASIDFGRIHELFNASGIDYVSAYVVEAGDTTYFIYRTEYSPNVVVEAYNLGSSAVVSVHYMLQEPDTMWRAWAHFTTWLSIEDIKSAASALGWSITEASNNTYLKCTTVTQTSTVVNGTTTTASSPPYCVRVVEVSARLEKVVDGARVVAVVNSFKLVSEDGSASWSPTTEASIMATDPQRADEPVKELLRALAGGEQEIEWVPPQAGAAIDVEELTASLVREVNYLVGLGALNTGGAPEDAIVEGIHAIEEINTTVVVEGSNYVISDRPVPPNPATIAPSIYQIPCASPLRPGCSTTATTVPAPTTTSATPSTPATSSQTQSIPSQTLTQWPQEPGEGSGAEEWDDLRNLAIALAIALASAAAASFVVSRE